MHTIVHMNTKYIRCNSTYRLRYWNYIMIFSHKPILYSFVATVLTVYGIETPTSATSLHQIVRSCNSTYRLRYWNLVYTFVLHEGDTRLCCNSTYRLRYWNIIAVIAGWDEISGCNSTYRLRYWNRCWFIKSAVLPKELQHYLPFTVYDEKFNNQMGISPQTQKTLP